MRQPLDQLKRYGEAISAAVPPARSRVAALRAVGAAERPRARRTPRVAAATVGIFAIANVAAAVVSNPAVPGDLLYPVDRAYEAVGKALGLGGDTAAERLEEAAQLAERSDLGAALDLVAEAVEEDEIAAAVDELRSGGAPMAGMNDEVGRLVESARSLNQARAAGDTQTLVETRAAIRLLAIQMADSARQNEDRGATPASPADPGEPGEPATPATPADPASPPSDRGNQGDQGDQGNQGRGDDQGKGGSRP
jgi:hypothetical protein